jgi:hypothetical protein
VGANNAENSAERRTVIVIYATRGGKWIRAAWMAYKAAGAAEVKVMVGAATSRSGTNKTPAETLRVPGGRICVNNLWVPTTRRALLNAAPSS